MELSVKMQERLATMLKVFPKHTLRNYENTIGLGNGRACVTNGFGLLIYHYPPFNQDVCLNRYLNPTSVKFPNIDGVIPDKTHLVPADEILSIVSALKATAPTKSKLRLSLTKNGDISLVAKDEKKKAAYDPHLIAQFLRGIPKNELKNPTKATAWLSADGRMLTIKINSYELILVGFQS